MPFVLVLFFIFNKLKWKVFSFIVVIRLQNELYIDMEDTDYDKRSALHLAAVMGNWNCWPCCLNFLFIISVNNCL
jgi:hypothetical protein